MDEQQCKTKNEAAQQSSQKGQTEKYPRLLEKSIEIQEMKLFPLSVKLKTNIYLNFKIHWLIRQSLLVNGGRVAKSICQFKNRITTSSPIKVNSNSMTRPFDKSIALNEYFTSISTLDNKPELPDILHCHLLNYLT